MIGKTFALILVGLSMMCSSAVASPAGSREPFDTPLAFDLAAAPRDGRFAWVVDDRGRRNVWVASPKSGSYDSKPLTRFDADDGLELDELAWTPASDAVVFARGGLLDGGRTPNIAIVAAGQPLREVWIAPLSGAPARRIGNGHAPAVSPRGDWIAYLDGGVVMLAPVDGSAPPHRAFVDIGSDDVLRWSPDGSRLAFVSDRDDHALAGVFTLATGAITWLAPSFDADRSPTWSPDGRRIAFLRTAARLHRLPLSRRAGEPWSLWVADVATGKGAAIFRADPGDGSVFNELDWGQNLFWAAGDRIVFPWEKTGWLNLYSVAAGGGAATPLARGSFEVFSAALSADRTQLVFAANRDNLDSRRLWTVPVAGGLAQPLTAAAGFQDRPVVGSGRSPVAFMQGDALRPFRPMVLASDLPRPLTPPDEDRPGAGFVVPQAVVFRSEDGLPIHAQLFTPTGATRGRHPAIVFFHGGPQRQMLPGWDIRRFYAESYAMNQALVARGYTVLSVNYRGGIGYGLDFREAERFGPGGASEEQDAVAAARWLRGRPDIDPARIGVYGASYGGLMTALALSRHSDLFAAGVDYAGVHDWLREEPALAGPYAPPDTARIARASSAMATLDGWRSPALIVQADDDRDVSFSQSVGLVEALRLRRAPIETLVLPNEMHDLRRHRSWVEWYGATQAFFDRYLKP